MQKIYKVTFLILSLVVAGTILARSVHRPVNPTTPTICASWIGSSKKHILRNDHLDPYTFFQLFDKKFFDEHLLPSNTISLRYQPDQSVDPKILKEQIEVLIKEVKSHKRRYTHFSLLQAKDFNRRKGNGLLILKFNDYPFVVKLFIERPETFVSPYHKGFEPIFFFYMGGGMNRHLAGFTRIKNLELIKHKIASNEQWKSRLDTPRKWYWIPQETPWIEIVGTHLQATGSTQKVEIPGTYCIIADAIEAEHKMSLLDSPENKKMILDVCNYLNLWVDPHLNNYMIEKESHKLVLVDTEHFASVVGLKQPIQFQSYFSWYVHLAGKFLQNTFGQSKRERRNHERAQATMILC